MEYDYTMEQLFTKLSIEVMFGSRVAQVFKRDKLPGYCEYRLHIYYIFFHELRLRNNLFSTLEAACLNLFVLKIIFCTYEYEDAHACTWYCQ